MVEKDGTCLRPQSPLPVPPRQHVLQSCPSPPHPLWAWAAVPTHPILWLEEALLLPPRVPGSLHIPRAVGVGHGATDIWGRGREGSVPWLRAPGRRRAGREGSGSPSLDVAYIVEQAFEGPRGRGGGLQILTKQSGESKNRAR